MKSKTKKYHSLMHEIPPKELYNNINWNDPANLGKVVKLFWWCSSNSNWDWFPFEKAFKLIKKPIKDKLGQHNRLPKKDQIEWYNTAETRRVIDQMNVHLTESINPEHRDRIHDALTTKWKENCKDEVRPSNLKAKASKEGYESWHSPTFLGEFIFQHTELRDCLSQILANMNSLGIYFPEFNKIKDVYCALKSTQHLSRKEKIELFDKAIHLHHHTGMMFGEWVDIDNLKKEFEEEYL